MITKVFRKLLKVPNKLLRYCQEFGVIRGAAHVMALRVLRPSRLYTIHVPALGRHITVRPNTSDVYVLEGLILHRDSSIPPMVIDAVAAGNGIVVDAGANIGISTLIFAKWWPSKTIVAIECEEENFALLERNVAGMENVRCVRAALWSSDGKVDFVDESAESWSISVREASASSGAVDAISLRTLARINHSFVVDFIKLDIEGAEREVLSSIHPEELSIGFMLVELHDRKIPGCTLALERLRQEYRFGCVPNGEYQLVGRFQT